MCPPRAKRNVPKFLSELGWREFNHHILFHHPDLATVNYRPEFDAFEWSAHRAPSGLAQGRTGHPARRCRHARALAHRLHAQPSAHGGGELPDQEPAHRLAARRAMVLGHPGATPTRRTTPATGSGSPGRGRMPRRTSASSTPSCRRASSTRRASTCGAGCPRSAPMRIRSRSSTSPLRGARRLRVRPHAELGPPADGRDRPCGHLHGCRRSRLRIAVVGGEEPGRERVAGAGRIDDPHSAAGICRGAYAPSRPALMTTTGNGRAAMISAGAVRPGQ